MTDTTTYTDAQVRDLLEEALTALGLLERQIRDLAGKLPELPIDASEGQFIEIGYERWERWEREVIDPDDLDEGESMPDELSGVTIFSNGWQSMSESGAACWMEYDGEKYVIPDDVDWC